MPVAPAPIVEGLFVLPHSCKLHDGTKELLLELDGIFAGILQTRDLTLRKGGISQIGGMKLIIEELESELSKVPCYHVVIKTDISASKDQRKMCVKLESFVTTSLETIYESIEVDGAIPGRCRRRKIWLQNSKYIVEDSDEKASAEFCDDDSGSQDDYYDSGSSPRNSHVCVLKQKSLSGLFFQGAEIIFLSLVAAYVYSDATHGGDSFSYFVFRDARSGVMRVNALTEVPNFSHILRDELQQVFNVSTEYESLGPRTRLENVLGSYAHLPAWQQIFCESKTGTMCFLIGVFGIEITAEVDESKRISERSSKNGDEVDKGAILMERIENSKRNDFGGDIELASMFEELKLSNIKNMRDHLSKHPDICHVLTEWQRALLVKKPADVYDFTQKHFTSVPGIPPGTERTSR